MLSVWSSVGLIVTNTNVCCRLISVLFIVIIITPSGLHVVPGCVVFVFHIFMVKVMLGRNVRQPVSLFHCSFAILRFVC